MTVDECGAMSTMSYIERETDRMLLRSKRRVWSMDEGDVNEGGALLGEGGAPLDEGGAVFSEGGAPHGEGGAPLDEGGAWIMNVDEDDMSSNDCYMNVTIRRKIKVYNVIDEDDFLIGDDVSHGGDDVSNGDVGNVSVNEGGAVVTDVGGAVTTNGFIDDDIDKMVLPSKKRIRNVC